MTPWFPFMNSRFRTKKYMIPCNVFIVWASLSSLPPIALLWIKKINLQRSELTMEKNYLISYWLHIRNPSMVEKSKTSLKYKPSSTLLNFPFKRQRSPLLGIGWWQISIWETWWDGKAIWLNHFKKPQYKNMESESTLWDTSRISSSREATSPGITSVSPQIHKRSLKNHKKHKNHKRQNNIDNL